jgi:hypothetical protein
MQAISLAIATYTEFIWLWWTNDGDGCAISETPVRKKPGHGNWLLNSTRILPQIRK